EPGGDVGRRPGPPRPPAAPENPGAAAMSITRWDWPAARDFQRGALVTGVVGLIACVAAAVWDREQYLQPFFRSYLLAFVTCLGLALGSLALWMLPRRTGGYWGFVIRRLLEAASRTLPLMLVLFVPVALGLSETHPWAMAGHAEDHRADYFS